MAAIQLKWECCRIFFFFFFVALSEEDKTDQHSLMENIRHVLNKLSPLRISRLLRFTRSLFEVELLYNSSILIYTDKLFYNTKKSLYTELIRNSSVARATPTN